MFLTLIECDGDKDVAVVALGIDVVKRTGIESNQRYLFAQEQTTPHSVPTRCPSSAHPSTLPVSRPRPPSTGMPLASDDHRPSPVHSQRSVIACSHAPASRRWAHPQGASCAGRGSSNGASRPCLCPCFPLTHPSITSIPSQIAFEVALFPHNVPLPAPRTAAWLIGATLHVLHLCVRISQIRSVPDSDLGWEDMYREGEGESWFDWVRVFPPSPRPASHRDPRQCRCRAC